MNKINNDNLVCAFHLKPNAMAINRVFLNLLYVVLIDALAIGDNNYNNSIILDQELHSDLISDATNVESDNLGDIFNGVYTECLLQLSYTCLQRKTLLYLKELNKLKEVSVFGDYVKFVQLNTSENNEDSIIGNNSDEFAYMIDKAVDKFFDNHLIRFSALGKDVLVPHKVEEFVGRKRRKGGGGGGGGHGGGGDGGKKKMMMMAMMCMKMKFMMMVPAMMGMMGMMSFKGMMFSMMSFMLAKMMLLMKLLEKKGGGGGGGGGDGSWASGGGGGGAWMPAGGQDYGGGGYDANGQWQSRSIIEQEQETDLQHAKQPVITYVKPIIRYNNKINDAKPLSLLKTLNDEVIKVDQVDKKKRLSRRKRGIIDTLQNAYLYWSNRMLGIGYKKQPNHPKYKVINGIKYVYQPVRYVQKVKTPKELQHNVNVDDLKPVVITDFNKGEIVEERVEGRMNKKKFHKMKDNMNETMDENPWE